MAGCSQTTRGELGEDDLLAHVASMIGLGCLESQVREVEMTRPDDWILKIPASDTIFSLSDVPNAQRIAEMISQATAKAEEYSRKRFKEKYKTD